jgi:hypothetical protein
VAPPLELVPATVSRAGPWHQPGVRGLCSPVTLGFALFGSRLARYAVKLGLSPNTSPVDLRAHLVLRDASIASTSYSLTSDSVERCALGPQFAVATRASRAANRRSDPLTRVTGNAGSKATCQTRAVGEKKRLRIAGPVMRELLFLSGGYCAMRDCRKPLIGPSGGWIGTVAHIIAAEDDGPRGDKTVTPEKRASVDNLILMCADHGREVDDPRTGEEEFPVWLLRDMKQEHEFMVTMALMAAVEQEASGLQGATRLLDTGLRPRQAHNTAAGLLEASTLEPGSQGARDIPIELGVVSQRLQRLSQPALETLGQLLALWRIGCQDPRDRTYDFGDPSSGRVEVDYDTARNRLYVGRAETFEHFVGELNGSGLLDYPQEEAPYYELTSPWNLWIQSGGNRGYSYNFWILAAEFLWHGHGILVDQWLPTLDFSAFDLAAPSTRGVPWR